MPQLHPLCDDDDTPPNECYNNFSPLAFSPLASVEAARFGLFAVAIVDVVAPPVPLVAFDAVTLDDAAEGTEAAALVLGGGWPGAFFNCQLFSSIATNFFRRSRYWLYSSMSLWPAPSTHNGSTAFGHFS